MVDYLSSVDVFILFTYHIFDFEYLDSDTGWILNIRIRIQDILLLLSKHVRSA